MGGGEADAPRPARSGAPIRTKRSLPFSPRPFSSGRCRPRGGLAVERLRTRLPVSGSGAVESGTAGRWKWNGPVADLTTCASRRPNRSGSNGPQSFRIFRVRIWVGFVDRQYPAIAARQASRGDAKKSGGDLPSRSRPGPRCASFPRGDLAYAAEPLSFETSPQDAVHAPRTPGRDLAENEEMPGGTR